MDNIKNYFDNYIKIYDNIPLFKQSIPNSLGKPILFEKYNNCYLIITSYGYLCLYKKNNEIYELVDFFMMLNAEIDEENPILINAKDLNEDTTLAKTFVLVLKTELIIIMKIIFGTITYLFFIIIYIFNYIKGKMEFMQMNILLKEKLLQNILDLKEYHQKL